MRNVPNELTFLSVFMGITALVLVGAGLSHKSVYFNFAMSLCIGCAVIFCFLLLTSPKIAKMNFLFFLQTSLAISTEGATFYFFTDDSSEFPNGPQFTIW